LSQTALQQSHPARMAAGKIEVNGLSNNRRHPQGPCDTDLHILRVSGADESTIASLLTFACHPIASGSGHRTVSADFPGALCAGLEAAAGGLALFTNGASADINPIVDGTLSSVGGSFEHVEHIGRNLADSALAIWDKLVPLESGALHVGRRVLSLPLQPSPSNAELLEFARRSHAALGGELSAENSAHYRIGAAMLQWAMETLQAQERGELKSSVEAEIQVIKLGNWALVNVPGELFTALGLAIKQSSSQRHTTVATYTNGNIGYIPTREEYPYGSYEIDDAYRYYGYHAAVAPEAGEMVVAATTELLGSTP
jgi:hypothetical protein